MSNDASADFEPKYPVVVTLPVLWGDMDAFGHVNNTIHIRWFESSRVAYLEEAGMSELMKAEKFGPILAGINCNYRRQVTYPDTIKVDASVVRVGRSSMTIAHRIYSSQQGAFVADGESVVVVFDYEKQRPVRVPQEFRETIAKMEGRSFP